MMLRREITAQIKEVLEKHPEGLSITDLVKSVDINRNTAGRYLENLLLSGQVEMRRFGMSKMYTLAKRLPVSSVLSMSSEFVLQLDLSQRIIYANEPFLRFLGAQAKDLLGKNIEFSPFSTVFEDDFPYLLDRFRRGLKGEEWRGELVHPVHGRIFFCRVAPTVFNEGAKGVSILLEDITDQKLDAERIRESEARLRSIFKVSPIGIGVIVNRTFSEVNDRFCQITGYSTAEMIGKSVRMLYSSEEEFRNVGVLYMNQIRETGFGSVETQWVKKGGTLIDVLLNTTPLDPSNISGGITFTALDITERKQAELALRASEERLHLALSASETGMWEMDFPSGKGSIDEGAAAILGYASDEIGTLQADWDVLSHPDDVPLIMMRITDYLEGRTSMFESEHRMRHKSGRWIWVLGRGKITYRSPDGSCKRISGTLKDITARKRAEDALREGEEKYRYLVEQSLQGLIIVQDGRPVYANPAIRKVTGYSPEEFQAFSPEEMMATLHPDDRDRIRAVMKSRLEGHDISNEDEFRIQGKDGRIRWVLARGIRITYNGQPAEQVTYFDITERKMAEQALRENEEKYRHLVEESLQGLTIIQNGRPVFANTAMLEIGGYPSLDEYLALSAEGMMATIHPDDRDRIGRVMADRLAGKDVPAENEFRVLRKDGQVRWVHTRAARIDYNNTPAIQVTYFDITGRRQAEQALSESEERLRQVMETLTSVFYVHERVSNQFIYVSPAYEKIWKRSCQSLYDNPYTYLEVVHPDDLPQLLEFIRRELEDSKYVDTEYRILQPDGTIRWIHAQNFPILDAEGKVYRVAGIAEDITSRKAAEEALRESEDRYRKLVEISPNAIILHQDGKIIYVNSELIRILGVRDAGEVVGREILDIVHPAYHQAIRENISRDLMGENTPVMDMQLLRADGSPVMIEGRGVSTIIGGRPAVLVALNDITERSTATHALQESENRYRTLAEASRDIIFVIGRDDRVEYVNSYAAAMLGMAANRIIGRERSSLFSGEPGERQARGLRRVFETGEAGRSEGPLRVSGSIRWFDHYLIPIKDPQGAVISVLGVSRDITDRNIAEQARKGK